MPYFVAFLLVLAVLLVLTRPFTTLFHELGHAIPKLLATKQGVAVYVGSYGDKKHSLRLPLGRLKIWIRYNPIGWSGGACVSESLEKTVAMRIVSVMGGVIFSLLITIIFVYLAFSQDMHGLVKMIMLVALGSAIFDLYINLTPREFKSADGKQHYTDGYLLRMLLPLRKYPAEYLEALTLFWQKNYTDAAKIFQKMLADGYQDRTTYKMAYAAYVNAKDYGVARSLYSDYEEKFTPDADDYYNRGVLNAQLKLTQERDACYAKALALNPNHAPTLNNLGYQLITEKRFAEAMPYFDKAIQYMPTMAYAYNNRGHVLLETGNLERGLADINRSLKLDNTNAYVYRNLGLYHLKQEQYERAHDFFLTAREMDAETDLIDELLQQTSAKVNLPTTS